MGGRDGVITTCYRFVMNDLDALLTMPECEDYCAVCGRHREDHR